jgi:ribosomal protein S18 acetylase RimI-like enzyme
VAAIVFALRPACPDDEAFLVQLYASTREEERTLGRWDDAQWQAFVEVQFTAQRRHYEIRYPGAHHLIIVIDDRRAGRFLVSQTLDELHLIDLALLPEYRNRGVGGALLRDALEAASRAGLPARLHVLKTSRAIRLYERLGFSVTGDAGSHFLMERWPPERR